MQKHTQAAPLYLLHEVYLPSLHKELKGHAERVPEQSGGMEPERIRPGLHTAQPGTDILPDGYGRHVRCGRNDRTDTSYHETAGSLCVTHIVSAAGTVYLLFQTETADAFFLPLILCIRSVSGLQSDEADL